MKKLLLWLLLLTMLGACVRHTEKHGLPFERVVLNSDYFCPELNTWIRFTDTSGAVSGFFYSDSGRAEAMVLPFAVRWNGDHWTCWYKNDSLRSWLFEVSAESDTSFTVMAYNKEYRFSMEKEPSFPMHTERYRRNITDSVTMVTVNFGMAKGYYTSKKVNEISEEKYLDIIYDVSKTLARNILMEDLPLEMDIYQPYGDSCSKRPLLLLIHGGAFMLGDKSSPTMKTMARYFAGKGYVVASVNYRMGFWIVPGAYYFLERAIYRATQDVRASLRYLSAHAEEYGIDTSRIYTCGNSAGGFLALNAAMMNDDNYFPSHKGDVYYLLDDLGCLDCSTNRLKDRFHVKAVVNMWGALTHIRMLTGRPDVPLLCFHGSGDRIIPPGHDYPFLNISRELSAFFTEKVFGSEIIYKYSRVTRTPVTLKMFAGRGHDPHINDDGTFNAVFDTIQQMTCSFLYPFHAAPAVSVKGKFKLNRNDDSPVYTCSVPDGQTEVFWKARGGKVVRDKYDQGTIRVIWFKGMKHELYTALRNRNHSVSFKSYPVTVR